MNHANKPELSRKEKLKEKGGALVAVIPFRMASTRSRMSSARFPKHVSPSNIFPCWC